MRRWWLKPLKSKPVELEFAVPWLQDAQLKAAESEEKS
jgi:hypothetical protein